MPKGKFATAVNCMDGRIQLPVIEYLKNRYGVDHVDSVTEPGPIKILTEGTNVAALESIKHRIDVSVNKHGSRSIALVGHHNCAGNPVKREFQEVQLKKSLATVKAWGFDAEIICLYVNARWVVEEIS